MDSEELVAAVEKLDREIAWNNDHDDSAMEETELSECFEEGQRMLNTLNKFEEMEKRGRLFVRNAALDSRLWKRKDAIGEKIQDLSDTEMERIASLEPYEACRQIDSLVKLIVLSMIEIEDLRRLARPLHAVRGLANKPNLGSVAALLCIIRMLRYFNKAFSSRLCDRELRRDGDLDEEELGGVGIRSKMIETLVQVLLNLTSEHDKKMRQNATFSTGTQRKLLNQVREVLVKYRPKRGELISRVFSRASLLIENLPKIASVIATEDVLSRRLPAEMTEAVVRLCFGPQFASSGGLHPGNLKRTFVPWPQKKCEYERASERCPAIFNCPESASVYWSNERLCFFYTHGSYRLPGSGSICKHDLKDCKGHFDSADKSWEMDRKEASSYC